LIDKPALLIFVLFVGAMIGIGIEKFVRWDNRRKWQRRQQRRGKVVPFERKQQAAPAPKIPDSADQLRTVMKADFKAQPLLNKSDEKRSLSGGQASTAVGCSRRWTRW
jgi:hypothetical protein